MPDPNSREDKASGQSEWSALFEPIAGSVPLYVSLIKKKQKQKNIFFLFWQQVNQLLIRAKHLRLIAERLPQNVCIIKIFISHCSFL